MQMLVGLNSGGVIAIFPERALLAFALIVLLPSPASDQLHAIGDNFWIGVSNQKVNVVAGYGVIEYRRPKPFFASKTQRR